MPKPRVTLIGWAALVVSVIASIGVFCSVWMTLYGDTVDDGGWSSVPDFVLNAVGIAAIAGLPIAILLDVYSGLHGRRNKKAGIIGGLILLLPIPLVFVLLSAPY